MVEVHQLPVQDRQHLHYPLVYLELEMHLVLQHWLGMGEIAHLDMVQALMVAMEEVIQVNINHQCPLLTYLFQILIFLGYSSGFGSGMGYSSYGGYGTSGFGGGYGSYGSYNRAGFGGATENR